MHLGKCMWLGGWWKMDDSGCGGGGRGGGNPGALAAQNLCLPVPRGPSTQWATTGAPEAVCGATSVRRGSGTQGASPGAPAAQHRCSSVPRGSSTQWVTAGAPEAPCGKERWARQGKEPPIKLGWAEPRTTTRSQCSVNHPGHHAGAHAACGNYDGAHATREAHATRNQQGTRPAHSRPMEWGSVCGGRPGQRVEEQGTWASRTQKHSEAGCGWPEDGGVWTAKTVKRPPQQPAQPQYANYWAPLTRKRDIPPHPEQPQHTNHGALRTRKRHQQEHRPQQPTESSDPTQHAKRRMTVQGPVNNNQTGYHTGGSKSGPGVNRAPYPEPPPPPPGTKGFNNKPTWGLVSQCGGVCVQQHLNPLSSHTMVFHDG